MPDVSVGSTAAYLAVPVTPGPWPGVVAIHEAFGLNDDIKAHADRLAALGYLALAPDLLAGRFWMRCVRSMFRQITAGSGPAFEVLDTCRGWLAERQDCTGKTGVIGFCMGGGFALMCAPRDGFSAAAVNYGVVPADAQRALAGSCPVVGSYGARDAMGVSHPERLEAALTALGVPHDVKVYPEAGHGFMDSRPAVLAPLLALARLQYDKAAAEDAWQRIFAFFGQYLKDLPAPDGRRPEGVSLGGLGIQVVVDQAAGGAALRQRPGRPDDHVVGAADVDIAVRPGRLGG